LIPLHSEKISMAIVELVIPKMGESIHEATIISWLKNVGDPIEEDETILEIATDKVDSDVPSPVNGTLHKILAQVNDVVPVGGAVALIETTEAAAGTIKVSTPEPEVQQEIETTSEVQSIAPAEPTFDKAPQRLNNS